MRSGTSFLRLLAVGAVLCVTAAQGQETYMQKIDRWQKEFRKDHPGQPMLSDGQLQKLHRDELIAQSNKDMADGRELRQQQLRHEYLLLRHDQMQTNAKNGVTWNAAQWRAWDEEYNRQREDQARAWLQAWYQMGELAREQAIQEEFDRNARGGN
ncbi:MAG: hypothetical protein ABI640_15805 [Gammaproteobacteria bacterium]